MKHLITGAAGFLGGHLIDALRAQDASADILSFGLHAPAGGVRHVECNLLEKERVRATLAAEKPDRVYHLAGSARVSPTIGMPEYFSSNFEITRHVLSGLEALAQAPRVFFASSVHVYGNQTDVVDETCPPAPNGFYGMSKYLAERALEQYAGEKPGRRVTIGRLYSCIGPGQSEGFVTSDLARKLLKLPPGGTLETGSLSATRRFLDARDAARIITRLVESDAPAFDIVNIASPFEMKVKDVVDLLVKVSGTQAKVHAQTATDNPFQGLRIDLSKLEARIPGFEYRTPESTVTDLWNWVRSHAA